MIRVELENPELAAGIFPGACIALTARPGFFGRVWAWIRRAILRRAPELPRYLTVASVDYESGVIELDDGEGE